MEAATPKVRTITEWLRHDIRCRGLRPGDRYMTSEEAARVLGVSTGTAHQAMRILVQQDILDGALNKVRTSAPQWCRPQRIKGCAYMF